jgi:hypothetical protein
MMIKLPLLIAVLTNILWLGPINAAESEKSRAAEELLDLTHIEKTVTEMRGQMTGMLAAQLRSANVPEAMREKLARLQQKISDLVFDELSYTKLRPAYVESYAVTFTADELNGLVEFFKTPVGRAYVEKMPILTKQIMALAQTQFVNIAPRIKTLTDEFVAELKREAAKQ